jgi:uncharacterized protein
VITLDATAVVALISTNDRHHRAARRILAEDRGGTVVPAGILSEIARVVGEHLGEPAIRGFFEGVIGGSTYLDCGDSDLPRVMELVARFRERSLGFADAAVIACAERNGGDILTFDRRPFEAVARDVPITLLP